MTKNQIEDNYQSQLNINPLYFCSKLSIAFSEWKREISCGPVTQKLLSCYSIFCLELFFLGHKIYLHFFSSFLICNKPVPPDSLCWSKYIWFEIVKMSHCCQEEVSWSTCCTVIWENGLISIKRNNLKTSSIKLQMNPNSLEIAQNFLSLILGYTKSYS